MDVDLFGKKYGFWKKKIKLFCIMYVDKYKIKICEFVSRCYFKKNKYIGIIFYIVLYFI